MKFCFFVVVVVLFCFLILTLKQGQPRPHTQLKAMLLTEQLKNDLFLRLHHSAHYYRLAILPIVILTLLVNMFFLRKFPAIPL